MGTLDPRGSGILLLKCARHLYLHQFWVHFNGIGTFGPARGCLVTFNYWTAFQWVVVPGGIVSDALFFPDCLNFM